MTKVNLIVIITLFSTACATGQHPQNNCNRKTPFKSVERKIDSVMCIPKGNIIVSIEEVDIDDMGGNDKILRWFNDYPRNDGDTTYHSLYLSKDGKINFYKTYDNLLPLYFELKTLSADVVLKDSALNEIKSIYVNPHSSTVKFEKGLIVIEFQLAAVEYQKLYFSFFKRRDTFVLTKAEYYFADSPNGLSRKLERTETYELEKSLDLEDFNYLDFIYR